MKEHELLILAIIIAFSFIIISFARIWVLLSVIKHNKRKIIELNSRVREIRSKNHKLRIDLSKGKKRIIPKRDTNTNPLRDTTNYIP